MDPVTDNKCCTESTKSCTCCGKRKNKTADMRTYMREWKKRDYEMNPEKNKLNARAFYYRYKMGISGQEMAHYKPIMIAVGKIHLACKNVSADQADLLTEYLVSLIQEIRTRPPASSEAESKNEETEPTDSSSEP